MRSNFEDRAGEMQGLTEAIERENLNLFRLYRALTTMDMKLAKVIPYHATQYAADCDDVPAEHRAELTVYQDGEMTRILRERREILDKLIERMTESRRLFDEI